MSTWHISEDSIDRYAIGALEGEALAEVEEHLLTCPDCQARLLEADEFVEVFRAAAVQPGVRPAKRRFFWQFGKVAWATAAASVILAGIFVASTRTSADLPPAIVELASLRGPEAAARIPAGKPALLKFDVLPQAPPGEYEIEVVDAAGFQVITTSAELRDGRLTAKIGKLAGGSYWVRVYSRRPVRELIAEYGLVAG
jgi:anti-sigma factor RsiW